MSYYPASEDVAGSLVTRDGNRIWQVAPRLSEHQFKDRQHNPVSKADQAQLRKLSGRSSFIRETSRLHYRNWQAGMGETRPNTDGVGA